MRISGLITTANPESSSTSSVVPPGEPGEVVEGIGVAQGVPAGRFFGWCAREDLLYGYLELLAVEGAGNVGDGEDLVRHVAGGSSVADAFLDPVYEVVAELGVFFEDHEERHKVLSILPDVHDEAVSDLRNGLDGAVDLAGPHPHATAVYCRVGATVDHGGAFGLYLDPIPVPPHARKHVEVALPEPLVVRVVPQIQGHRGHRLGNDQLPNLVYERVTLLVEGLDLCP